MNNIELDYDLLALLPPWYRRILDYQQICTTEEAQFEALAQEITAVAQNFFFQTMDAGAVAQWETIFGIVANPATESLSFRQARILNRVSIRPPFTLGFLYQRLDELIGPGLWTVRMDYPNYTLYIQSAAKNLQYAQEIAYTIGRIVPAHIVYIITPTLTASIIASETIELSKLIYNYKLGAWGLGLNPFATEQSLGVIKTPNMPSIQPLWLNTIAASAASDIASVRLNGSVTISPVTATADESTITVTYSVTPEQAATITQIELLNSSGAALTSASLYIAVAASTIITHTIPVSEGVNS